MYPSYLNFSKKELNKRVEKLFKILKKCEICPRKCGVNRLKEEKGFCQWEELKIGKEVSFKEMAKMMINLQNQGCLNINFVTPTPQVPQIVKAVFIAIEMGLRIPLVYNTNAYDSVKTLKLLEGIFDIYMPDVKYSENRKAERYSNVPNYFEIMKKAVKEMHR